MQRYFMKIKNMYDNNNNDSVSRIDFSPLCWAANKKRVSFSFLAESKRSHTNLWFIVKIQQHNIFPKYSTQLVQRCLLKINEIIVNSLKYYIFGIFCIYDFDKDYKYLKESNVQLTFWKQEMGL